MANPERASGNRPRRDWRRLRESAVLWSWLFNGLRLASGLLLLPLLLRVLPDNDMGMYYVFLSLATVVPMMDFGFALSVERALAYALGGATALTAHGVSTERQEGGANEAVIHDVVFSARRLYRWLSLGTLVFLAAGGSLLVGVTVQQTARPAWTWMAWGVHAVTLSLEIYTGYWVAVLRGLNQVTRSARWLSLAYGLKLGLASGLLLAGAGLMAVPLAGLVAGLVLRAGAGRDVRQRVGRRPEGAGDVRAMVQALWPNSWRLGVQLGALFVSNYVYTYLCSHQFGLEVMYQYGLSVQILWIAHGIAAVWTSVKWPIVAQLRMRGDREAMKRTLWPRVWLQYVTYAVLAGGAILVGPVLIEWIKPDKALLARPILLLLAFDALGQMNFTLWTSLIATENRIPAVWPLVATHAAGWIVASILILGVGWGVETLALTPLVLGGLFNYWWWGREGAKVLGTHFLRFLFGPLVRSHARN